MILKVIYIILGDPVTCLKCPFHFNLFKGEFTFSAQLNATYIQFKANLLWSKPQIIPCYHVAMLHRFDL